MAVLQHSQGEMVPAMVYRKNFQMPGGRNSIEMPQSGITKLKKPSFYSIRQEIIKLSKGEYLQVRVEIGGGGWVLGAFFLSLVYFLLGRCLGLPKSVWSSFLWWGGGRDWDNKTSVRKPESSESTKDPDNKPRLQAIESMSGGRLKNSLLCS